MTEHYHIKIGTESFDSDRTFFLDLAVALSELHGRKCAAIGSCGDTEIADDIAKALPVISKLGSALREQAD